MVKQTIIGKERNNGKNSKQVKPSEYLGMVLDAIQSLKDHNGSIPKRIISYITNSYNLTADKKVISSSVFRALKQGQVSDLILKNSYGHYKLGAKSKQRSQIPAKKRKRRRRKGKKRSRKKGKRRRKKAKKKGRRRKKRKSSKRKRRRRFEEEDEPKKRKRQRKHFDDFDY